MHATRQRRFLTGVLVTFSILMSAAITAPFFYSNRTQPPQLEIRQTKDMGIHLAVMEQFDKVLRSGALYPRWLPETNYGYGNAWPNFYQPGFYYLTSLVYAVTDNWVDTLFVITALGLFASGLAFYVLARLFFGKPASAIAAAVYMLLPYHLLDVFVRGAIPEYLSFVLLPLILCFFYRLGNEGRARYYAGLGVCYGACLMIHIPIAYLLSFIIVIYALVWSAAQRDWRIALRIGLGMTVGVLLSAIYWVPAVSEIKYAVETVTTLFQYDQNYISLLYADSYGEVLGETFAIQASALLIVIAAVLWLKLSESRRLKSSLPPLRAGTASAFFHESVWIGMGVFSLFMNLPVSYYVARLIPRINVVAFPYRWLVFVCLFTALVTAALIDRLHGRIREAGKPGLARLGTPDRMALASAVAILALKVWFSAYGVVIASLSSPMITREMNFLCDTYCPAGAPAAGKLPLTERIVLESSSGRSDILEWSPLFRKAVITTDEPTTARFKTFKFPGWTARVDGADVEILSDPIEAQVINVPQGEHTVEITYGSTPARNLGAAISVSGLFLVFILMLSDGLRLWKRRQSP
ncbi:MAG TPA: 6-pyruvoyl-tetrahydropterin synthase-related protein [Blastocatellia bacterium]|nr:6-pyruvoyl-tetrahydropterin synthase-related protein [Blastocatellia bacterium]